MINDLRKDLLQHDFKFWVKAKDKFLSGWGCAENRTHLQIVAVRTREEVDKMLRYFRSDKSYSYATFGLLSDYSLNSIIKGNSYTIRTNYTVADIRSDYDIDFTNGHIR